MYPVSIAAVLLRLGIHRLLRDRMLNSGEVLALGVFEGTVYLALRVRRVIAHETVELLGAVLYHALNESAAVGAGCFLGFGTLFLSII